jgi:hypothetical protein
MDRMRLSSSCCDGVVALGNAFGPAGHMKSEGGMVREDGATPHERLVRDVAREPRDQNSKRWGLWC